MMGHARWIAETVALLALCVAGCTDLAREGRAQDGGGAGALPAEIVAGDVRIIHMEAAPYILLGSVMMAPAAPLLEWLGAEMDYDAAAGTVIARRGDTEIHMRVGEREALVNGEERHHRVQVDVREGHVYVPLRFVAEALGAQVRGTNAAGRPCTSSSGIPPSECHAGSGRTACSSRTSPGSSACSLSTGRT